MQVSCCQSRSGQKGLLVGANPSVSACLTSSLVSALCWDLVFRLPRNYSGVRYKDIGRIQSLTWVISALFCIPPIFISSPMAFWSHFLGSKFIRARMWLLENSYLFQTRTNFTFASSGQWSYIPKSQGIRTGIAPVARSLCSTLHKDKSYKGSQVKFLEWLSPSHVLMCWWLKLIVKCGLQSKQPQHHCLELLKNPVAW